MIHRQRQHFRPPDGRREGRAKRRVQPYTASEAPFIPGQPSSGPKAVNGLVRIDALVVRSLLVPALTVDIGRPIWWPGKLRQTKP